MRNLLQRRCEVSVGRRPVHRVAAQYEQCVEFVLIDAREQGGQLCRLPQLIACQLNRLIQISKLGIQAMDTRVHLRRLPHADCDHSLAAMPRQVVNDRLDEASVRPCRRGLAEPNCRLDLFEKLSDFTRLHRQPMVSRCAGK